MGSIFGLELTGPSGKYQSRRCGRWFSLWYFPCFLPTTAPFLTISFELLMEILPGMALFLSGFRERSGLFRRKPVEQEPEGPMWATKNHRNTDGLKTGFQWAKYIVTKIYFNKNLFCSHVIAIHFQTIFSSKRQRSPYGFASFFQIRSYFTTTFLLSSTALQTFLCTSCRRGRKQSEEKHDFAVWADHHIRVWSPSGFIPPTSQVHLSKKSTVSLVLLLFLGKLFDYFDFTSDLCIPQAFCAWKEMKVWRGFWAQRNALSLHRGGLCKKQPSAGGQPVLER